jgi:hypothetical protein
MWNWLRKENSEYFVKYDKDLNKKSEELSKSQTKMGKEKIYI